MSRKKLLLIFMGIFVLLAEIGFYIPIGEEDAQVFYDQFTSQVKGIDSVGIAIHNLSIALGMFIPGIGVIFGAFASIQTGLAFGVVNIVQSPPIEIHPAMILAITPFGIMEWVAYSLGMSRSYMLFKAIKRTFGSRRNLKRALNGTWQGKPIDEHESEISLLEEDNTLAKSQLQSMLKPTCIEIGIVIVLLAVGGFVEHWMIQEMGSMITMMGD